MRRHKPFAQDPGPGPGGVQRGEEDGPRFQEVLAEEGVAEVEPSNTRPRVAVLEVQTMARSTTVLPGRVARKVITAKTRAFQVMTLRVTTSMTGRRSPSVPIDPRGARRFPSRRLPI